MSNRKDKTNKTHRLGVYVPPAGAIREQKLALPDNPVRRLVREKFGLLPPTQIAERLRLQGHRHVTVSDVMQAASDMGLRGQVYANEFEINKERGEGADRTHAAAKERKARAAALPPHDPQTAELLLQREMPPALDQQVTRTLYERAAAIRGQQFDERVLLEQEREQGEAPPA